ncbi:MAG TPA: hypothetical protein VKX40_02445 [Aequorivita sp.]|nr:hypothetical protein [Aequorivita sp.]
MITKEQYLEAKKIIEAYHQQLELHHTNSRIELLKAKKGDYITYIGGSKSKKLIKGNKYRLTCAPWNIRVAVINESGKRQVFKNRFFTV